MRVSGNIKVYVKEIRTETATVKQFRLYPLDGKPMPMFSGGSHITTYIRNGDDLIERHYSLINNPMERDYFAIAIQRDKASKGGSVYWHDHVREGDQLEISFPKNHFHLSFKAKRHVFFAAGIGITPFLSMMADLQAAGKPFELHYAARSEELCAFYELLNAEYPGNCHFYFSQGSHPKRMAPDIMLNHAIGTHVYFCGPDTMVKQFIQAAESYGYPRKSIHFELFSPPQSGPQHPFKVLLKNTNCVIDVPADATLLETLLKSGIDAPYSCRAGGCGQCEVSVLEGEVDHRDLFFSEEERKQRKSILTCVSRSKSDQLVLQL